MKRKIFLAIIVIIANINFGICQSDLGSILKKDYYIVSSQQDFEDIMKKISQGYDFLRDTIELKIDIDGGGINNDDKNFSGILLGGKHKIKNLSKPLFHTLYGEISDIEMDGSCKFSGKEEIAPICIDNRGTIRNCINRANVTGNASNNMLVGGICATSHGLIINCENYGTISSTLNNTVNYVNRCGGITAYQCGGKIVACSNYANVSASSYYIADCGGIVAHQEGGQLVGCSNYGIIKSTCVGASPSGSASSSQIIQETGGISGRIQGQTCINRCRNYGNVTNNSGYSGGVIGTISSSDIYNCENHGNVKSVDGKFYSCAAGITCEFKAYDMQRQYYNCINDGNISSHSTYGIATAAGVSSVIENASIANLYSSGSVSAKSFEIQDYEVEDNSIELSKAFSVEQANSFILADNSSKLKLLDWTYNGNCIELVNPFYTLAIPSHGCIDVYVFSDTLNAVYNLTVINNETDQTSNIIGSAPLRISHLTPTTTYDYHIIRTIDNSIDSGNVSTLSPVLSFQVNDIGYDSISVRHDCVVNGVDDIAANLLIYEDDNIYTQIEVIDTTFIINNLDEETEYGIECVYVINGKEFKLPRTSIFTKSITPIFNLISATPYSLKLKCENFNEIQKFNPKLYVDSPESYIFGGSKIKDSQIYELDSAGYVHIDSLLYDYSPKLYGQYSIKGETRRKNTENFSTSNWGGEGIIQLSPNAAMVHGIFGGMGKEKVPGYSHTYYDTASFFYRDATASDEVKDSYIDGACIDGNLDYAVTIPIESFMSQYYISLRYSGYRTPQDTKDGTWQIVDARNFTCEIVEPRFYNIEFDNKTFSCSCIQGEETIAKKMLDYRIEDVETYNNIVLSTKSGTESLRKTLNSIVPQLTYVVRLSCETTNGKVYKSPVYRLHDGKLTLADDINEEETGINEIIVGNTPFQFNGHDVIINDSQLKSDVYVYDELGRLVYRGFDHCIKIPSEGVYIIKYGNYIKKIKK